MPAKKRKYNARFPAGRIKKIMQTDEEVGKIAQVVPIIISRTVELFIESLLTKTLRITQSRNARTISPSHMKQCIMSEKRFDFLRDLVKDIPDIGAADESAEYFPDTGTSDGNSSEQSYGISIPSTSYGIIQNSPNLSNGNIALRNGLEETNRRIPSATATATAIATATSTSTITTDTAAIDNQNQFKRYFNDLQRSNSESPIIQSPYAANFYKENSVIQHTSNTTHSPSSPPPKLMRTDSAPPKFHSSNNNNTMALFGKTKNSLRTLQHQSKSIPCASKDTLQQPVALPPIVKIDVCNTPIVKIDYSNLTLPDADGESSDSDSGTKQKQLPKTTCNDPIINIDLSKLRTQMNTTNIQMNSSTLDLDEDYDNI